MQHSKCIEAKANKAKPKAFPPSFRNVCSNHFSYILECMSVLILRSPPGIIGGVQVKGDHVESSGTGRGRCPDRSAVMPGLPLLSFPIPQCWATTWSASKYPTTLWNYAS